MSFPVIVTRAEPAAADTVARLKAAGYDAILSPALTLENLPDAALEMEGVHHLIFTSANGARSFLQRRAVGAQTVWCVGEATAAAVREVGGEDVREGDGNAADLAAMILAAPEVQTGALLHIANAAAAGDLVATLKNAGLDARFAALYRTVPVKDLSPEAVSALDKAPRVVVLVHSAKGAAAFRAAARGRDLSRVVFVAISPAASQPLAGCGARAVVNAAHPNETALMDALDTAVLAL
ncbi:uroporphyrinogen-III synthase [Hyphomonas sp.]|uniref:uroporphyrinogen-III synthase n=1 Tax=Hyphomonas sp. TaxID=87 RepID=UPI0039E42D0D